MIGLWGWVGEDTDGGARQTDGGRGETDRQRQTETTTLFCEGIAPKKKKKTCKAA